MMKIKILNKLFVINILVLLKRIKTLLAPSFTVLFLGLSSLFPCQDPAIRLSILAIMPSASAMSASVCLISSLSSGGSGLGKPGGKRGSLLTVSLLAWFE
jgi:hypothetical protein